MLALGAAPAIVRVSSLMPVRQIVLPTLRQTAAVNGLLTIDMITKEALRILEQQLRLDIYVGYSPDFTQETLTIRKPAQ